MLSTKAVVVCEGFSAVIFRRIELPTKHPPSPNYGAAGAK
jgi:hypothetical protein